jgi:hypothetical protein
VSLRVSSTTAKAGQNVQFTADASDADGTIAAVRLDYGDGTADVIDESTGGIEGPHSYAAPGIYEARFSATDDDGATSTSDAVRIFVSGPGTKDALIDDARCPGDFDVVVDINIPSYAQNPSATFTGTPCAGSAVTLTSAQITGTNPAVLDEWGRPKSVYEVVLHVTGGTATRSTLTVTAHWQ